MSIAVNWAPDRRDRVTLQRSATLRSGDALPVDIEIDDISSSGCLIRCDSSLELGELVSVGVPGIGVQAARVMRAEAGHYGCAFQVHISEEQIDWASRHNSIIEGLFPSSATEPLLGATSDQMNKRFSRRRRLAIIAGCGAIMWTFASITGLAIIHG